MSGRGRPRAFDREAALGTAMRLFWERGYEATSLTDITDATGVNSPSLYSCFGSKESLFRAAVELYAKTESGPDIAELFAKPTARESVQAMLRERVIAFTEPDKPRGCMIVLSGTNSTHDGVREFLTDSRQNDGAALRGRLDRGVLDGDLPAGTDTGTLARFVTTILYGLSIQARDGSSREDLHAVVDAAMTTWDALAAEQT